MNADELTPHAKEAVGLCMRATLPEVDAKLQELLASNQAYHPLVLAIWLRVTFSISRDLPTWQPLLNQTVQRCRECDIMPEEALYGLTGKRAHPLRNTDVRK